MNKIKICQYQHTKNNLKKDYHLFGSVVILSYLCTEPIKTTQNEKFT